MILELTENEQISLLGVLEDLSQEDGIEEWIQFETRIAVVSIIKKLGGTYFGKLDNLVR